VDDGRGLRHKLLWLIGLRAACVTLLLGSAAIARVRGLPILPPVDPFAAIAGVTYALTLLYVASLRFVEIRRWLLDVQLGIDALLVSALVLVTGGIESYFSTIYVLPVVAAAVLRRRRGGLLVAASSGALYAGVVLTQYTDAFGLVSGSQLVMTPGSLPPPRVALFTVGLNASGFTMVALLTGYLAENLRQAGQHLEWASSQIADLRALSQHVIDSLTGGLATADQTGRVLTFNRAAERIVGRTATEARGRTVRDVLQLPAGVSLADPEPEADPRGQRTEYVLVRPDGSRIDLGLTAAPLVTVAGRAGWIFSFQDLTDAKRREREAQRQRRLAAVGEMAAGIAHEIRNPLASMTGSIQILRQELTLSSDQAELMDIVLRESERLNETIRNFLAYARPRRQAASRFEVGRLLRDTATLLRNSPECNDRHRLEVDLGAPEIWFEADEGQIRQIVWNLASNAVRAMPEGGRLWLRAALAQDGPKRGLELAVRDEGVGIPAEELDSVFHPFRSSFDRGTGLGLAIVHRIVTDHGGEVEVSSAPGQGTEVRAFIPGGIAVQSEEPAVPPDEKEEVA
jgi:two-component system sensor histidine kinase PilS (NtrC family)